MFYLGSRSRCTGYVNGLKVYYIGKIVKSAYKTYKQLSILKYFIMLPVSSEKGIPYKQALRFNY